MSNTLKKSEVTSLILRRGHDDYLGVCKEFGFVEEGTSAEGILEQLNNSCRLLLDTVRKKPRLAPSLNVSPPLKYLVLFYLAPVYGSLLSFFSKFKGDIRLITKDRGSFAYALGFLGTGTLKK